MRVVLYCHSLLSDWNHGNAHFLRGVVTELASRGHEVRVFEPRDAWSVENLICDHGAAALDVAACAYPSIRPVRYDLATHDVDEALEGADLVLVHEWNEPELVRRIGDRRKRAASRFRLLFHDTHHRSVTDPDAMAAYDLSGFDGVLAFGEAVRRVYERKGWASRAFVWHEAADVRVFRPCPRDGEEGHVVWIGNWGDDERTAELREFLLEPVRDLALSARVYGVRYPDEARDLLAAHGIAYSGWLPNPLVPEVLARFRFTVHIPRRPYVRALPGVPTIRVFEALACGAPLVTSPWTDAEGLFTPGRDYLVARDGDEMRRHMRLLVADPDARRAFSECGRATVLARHTCRHRVDELLAIARSLGVRRPQPLEGAHPA